MGSSLGSYEIARSGLYVNERSLTVTGHNLSNASTIGYSRQQAIIATSRYTMENGKFQVGQGAQIEQTRQIRSTFLDAIYRKESMALGYWDTRNKSFEDVQAILGDPALTGVDEDLNIDGLQNVMNQFWDSWQELSKDPSSLTIRALVRQRGSTLVDQINHIGEQLDKMQMNLNEELKTSVESVNAITAQIAKLNVAIMENEVNGDHANDYRDQRNLLIDQLSRYANVEVQGMSGGSVTITLSGNVLVDKGVSSNIKLDHSDTYGPFYVPKMEGTDTAIKFKSGSIKALLDSRGDKYFVSGDTGTSAGLPSDVDKMSVSDVKRLLNNVVLNIATQINTLHKQGQTLAKDGSGNHYTNQAFFSAVDTTRSMGLGNIKLEDKIMLDVNYIVASKTGEVGNNEIAKGLADLRNVAMLGAATEILTPNEYYAAIITALGNKGQEAASNTTSQGILVQSADDSRTSIMGVSTDEEMANLMKYQFAYGASSRVMNVIDDMIETVVTRMGVVGR